MRKMIKWSLIGTGGLFLVSWLLLGSSVTGYGEALLRNARSAAEGAMPLDLQLDRVAVSLEKVDEQLRSQRKLLAEIEVGVEDLQIEIKDLAAKEREAVTQIEQLREAYLATGNGARPVALYRGRRVKADAVARSLDASIVRVEGIRERHTLKKQLLDSRIAHVDQVHRAMHDGVISRNRLQVSLDTRRVELECARMSEQDLGGDQPASALRDASAILGTVDRKIRVMKKMGDIGREGETLWLTDARSGEALQDRAARLLGDTPADMPLEEMVPVAPTSPTASLGSR